MRLRDLSATPTRVAVLVALAASLSASAGCKATPSAAENFCDQWVAAFCEGNRECCMSPSDAYPDVDTCKSRERARCVLGSGTAFTAAEPIASFNVAEGARALEDLRAAGAPGACTPPPSLDSYALVIGTLTVGSDCSAIGGDFSPFTACEPNARCLLAASRAGTLVGQCVRESGLGEGCVAETCVPGAYCADLGDPSSGGTGTCAAQKADGEACVSARECVTGTCVSSLCGVFLGAGASPWCVVGAGLGGSLPPPDDAGSDPDAGL